MAIDVRVEHSYCCRSGFCEGAAAEVFQLRPDAKAVDVLLPHLEDEDLIQQARDAADICPTQAIIIEGS